ncbi:hypothetical protein [Azotobacter beijerinckii]|uniref:Uncharacterized protein n=1 Tax=Azotobacter beijerinckii TaxID=170623 RepID=A0A1I0Z588_9GAMM|nr:hypothetical protein [Azotobacter beijerinckii]SFB19608.1 hypothetical protein SAMN04244571_01744 [Azotobacter beijerinckii]
MADIPRWIPLRHQAEARRQRAAKLRAQIEAFEASKAEHMAAVEALKAKNEARA